MIGLCSGTNSDVCVRNYLYPVFLLTKTQPRGFYQWNFHQRHASPWLTGWPSTRIMSCCVLSAFIINKSKTKKSKGCKRFATTTRSWNWRKTFKIKYRKSNKTNCIFFTSFKYICLLCSVFSKQWLVYAARTNTDVFAQNYLFPVFLLTKTEPPGFYQWIFIKDTPLPDWQDDQAQ